MELVPQTEHNAYGDPEQQLRRGTLADWCASSGLLFVYVHRMKQVAAVDELANVTCGKEPFQNVYIQLCLLGRPSRSKHPESLLFL